MGSKDKAKKQLQCLNCGAPIHPEWGTQVIICQYCGSVQQIDIDWKRFKDEEPKPTYIRPVTPPPPAPKPVVEPRPIAPSRPSRPTWLYILAGITVLCLFAGLFSDRSKNSRTTSRVTQKATPVMLSKLPASAKAGETLHYKGWSLKVLPLISAGNNRIKLELELTNWQPSKQNVRYKVNTFTLYQADGTVFPQVEKPCTAGTLHEERQQEVAAKKTVMLSSSSSWCNYSESLPLHLGTIPVTEKQLFLKIVKLGVFENLIIVFDL